MRSKRDIKMGRLCTPGGAVLGIVGGGVTFRFLNGEAILDENRLFWVRLYALVVILKILLDYIILLINNSRVLIINLTVIPIQPNCSSVQKELKSVPVALKGTIASSRNCE